MKNNTKSILIIVLGVLLIIATISGTVFASKKYLASKDTKKTTATDCSKAGKAYEFVIENDVMTPSKISIIACDSITVKNKDDTQRLLAFGEHEDHDAYQNLSELPIGKDQSVNFIASSAGTFIIHDHYQDEVSAIFVVKQE